jgi:hypothetical protein
VQGILCGINGIVYSPQKMPKIDLIPLEDRVMLLSMAPTPMNIARGSWVRIKRKGRYRNDLGLVEYIDQVYSTVVVLLAPQIPLDRKRNQKRHAKPGLFDPEAVTAHYGADTVVRRNQMWCFKHQMYTDGLVLLDYQLHELSDRSVDATQDELNFFRQTQNQWVVEAANSGIVPLHIADRIQVVAGPHQGFSGYLTDLREDRTATFESDTAPCPLQVFVREVRKLFQLGDYVQAVYGENQGAEGFIVEMGEFSATIYKDKVVKYDDTWHQQPGDEVSYDLYHIIYDNVVFFV